MRDIFTNIVIIAAGTFLKVIEAIKNLIKLMNDFITKPAYSEEEDETPQKKVQLIKIHPEIIALIPFVIWAVWELHRIADALIKLVRILPMLY